MRVDNESEGKNNESGAVTAPLGGKPPANEKWRRKDRSKWEPRASATASGAERLKFVAGHRSGQITNQRGRRRQFKSHGKFCALCVMPSFGTGRGANGKGRKKGQSE